MAHVVAIDQGTTSSRSIIFDKELSVTAVAQEEFPQHYPQSGWVEHSPKDILETTLSTFQGALKTAGLKPSDIAAIGITNQRETTILWDKTTGEPVYNAIVWQDRRTADICTSLKEHGLEELVQKTTGLLLDPYFSGTKVKWLLENVEGVRARAEAGTLLFGTIDCFLIWHLTAGKRHVTDATNAARTLLYDITKGCWSSEICAALGIPMSILPEVLDCRADFGTTDAKVTGAPIPIRGVAGDQQAATIGQACFEPGMLKSTYGTGCFALLNTGTKPVFSKNRLLTTIAYQFDGKPTYALEGSIFIAGAVVQWLRDGLGIIENAAETQKLAENADDSQTLYLVPAFVGLGAPYWKPDCRGAVFGLTRGSGPAEMARAALQSVGYQTADLLAAMKADWPEATNSTLRVDGGMAASTWSMQFLADILDAPVDRPKVLETTAKGVAWLAGSAVGLYAQQEAFSEHWARDARFEPAMKPAERQSLLAGWQRAINATLSV